MQDFLAFINR